MRYSVSLSLAALIVSYVISASVVQAQTATIKGSDVLIIGDSFFAMSGEIGKFLAKHARDDGLIGSGESFRSAATVGHKLAAISNQYSSANPKPKWVIMDAGGNDCLQGTCSNPVTIDCAALKTGLNGVQPLLDKMKDGGTTKVLWMRYPEPFGTTGTTLKPKLDVLLPEIEKVCKASTNPKVLWVDLRPIWGNTTSYAQSDGIHPTTTGSQATADAFWKAIKDSNFFDIPTPVQPYSIVNTAQSSFLGTVVSNNCIFLSLFLAQPTGIAIRITTVSGRTVASTARMERIPGFRTVQFPRGAIAPGVYCLEVQAGQFSEQSSLFLR